MSQLVELYRFISTDLGIDYSWTSGDSLVSHLGDPYIPTPISRSSITQGSDINRDDIKITVPIDNPIASMFLSGSVEKIVTVTLFRKIDETVNAWWKGRIVNVTGGKESTCEIQCESVFTSLRRAGNRARFQKQCRHMLYGPGCGVFRGAYSIAPPIITDSQQNHTVITAPPASLYGNGYFTGGYIEYNGKTRFIVSQIGDVLTLWRSFPELIEAPAFSTLIYAGCNKSIFTCRDKFNNYHNFGGFPWIPDINPFGGSQLW